MWLILLFIGLGIALGCYAVYLWQKGVLPPSGSEIYDTTHPGYDTSRSARIGSAIQAGTSTYTEHMSR